MITGIVQVRMASVRLPQKALADICGKPLLSHVIDRAMRSRSIDRIVIATTVNPGDDVIENFGIGAGIDVFRGNDIDVLDRFYRCAKKYSSDFIVRITADDPFREPVVIDRAVGLLVSGKNLDYVSNTIKPTYPEGLDVEVFTFKALERAWKEAKMPSEREHVTPYIWKNPLKFSLLNFENDKDLSGIRLTLDNDADLKLTREIYNRLYKPGRIFTLGDILLLLEKEPWIKKINSGIERNEGYKKSIREEKKNETHR